MISHERKVEKFYSHGSDLRSTQAGGFLSFGLWQKGTADYRRAASDLLSMVLENEKVLNRGCILNAACGYGAETFEIYEKLSPEKIIAIDVTEAHIAVAKKRAAELALTQKIVFEKQDACILPYKPGSFAYVIGIEGPAHFNTREIFLRRAFDILEAGGVLLNHGIVRRVGELPHAGRNFVDTYVFPDGELIPVSVTLKAAEDAGFEIRDLESLREHYALTLRHWVSRLEKSHDEALQYVDEPAYRVWRLFMSGSANGFTRGKINVYQALLSKSGAHGASGLPLTRADWYESGDKTR